MVAHWLQLHFFAFENHIKSQNNRNLSANNPSPTQTVCNHSQTGWWKFAINLSQSPTSLQLVSLQQGKQLDWLPTVVSYINPKLLSSYVILQLNCCRADLVAQPHSIAKLVDWLQISNVVRATFRLVSVKYNKHDKTWPTRGKLQSSFYIHLAFEQSALPFTVRLH